MSTVRVRLATVVVLSLLCIGLSCSGKPDASPSANGGTSVAGPSSTEGPDNSTTETADTAADVSTQNDPWRVPPDCPLTSDGYVDYMAPIYERSREGVTRDNNAAVLLWQAFGPTPVPEDKREEYFAGIGMDVPPIGGDYFVTLKDFARRPEVARRYGAQSDEQIKAMQKAVAAAPWTAEQFPLIHDWLAANRAALKLAVRASVRERSYVPQLLGESTAIMNNLLPGTSERIGVADSLVARGMLTLGSGDVEAAWLDVMACHRLTRLWGQDRSIVQTFVSIVVDGRPNTAVLYLATHANLTSDAARRFEADLSQLAALPAFADRIDEDGRYMCLDAIARMKRDGPGAMPSVYGEKVDDSFSTRLTGLAVNWDTVADVANQWHDRVVEIANMPTYAESKRAMAPIERELESLEGFQWQSEEMVNELLRGRFRQEVGQQMGELQARLFLSDTPLNLRAEIRQKTNFDFARLALALAAHKADHGDSPVSLADLVPDYLPEIPIDRFSGGPLNYRKQIGGYVLYSVGPNLQVDEGNGATNQGSGDDIVVRVPPGDQE